MELDWVNLPSPRRVPPIPTRALRQTGLAPVPESSVARGSEGSAGEDDEDELSNVADEGDWTDEEVDGGNIHVRLWTAGGVLAGTAVVDADAKVGQLVTKLDKLPAWDARYDYFVVGHAVSKFRARHVHFTRAAAVQEAVVRDARGDRILHARLVSSDV